MEKQIVKCTENVAVFKNGDFTFSAMKTKNDVYGVMRHKDNIIEEGFYRCLELKTAWSIAKSNTLEIIEGSC